ncbi:MAG: hypothetical protein U1E76_00870 [Planctomycetota bacterium]
MSPSELDRRRFLARSLLTLSGALAVTALTGCAHHGGGGSSNSTSVEIFRLSGRGRRISRAAKSHNASLRFATQDAAEANRAHAADRSRVVRLTISREQFDRLFASGPVVDLRHV